MEKKLLLMLLAIQFHLVATTAEDLAHAVKNLDVNQVKTILEEKAHEFNKNELTGLKESVKKKVKRPLQILMWYQNYRSLAKIGAGITGTIVGGRLIAKALSVNPEVDIPMSEWLRRFIHAQPSRNPLALDSRSVSTTLCIASGIVGTLGVLGIIKGAKEIHRYQKHSKVYALNNLIEKALA